MGPVKQNLCRDGGEEMQVFGRSMHTMVVAGQRLVIFGGVHERGALQDVLFLENAASNYHLLYFVARSARKSASK